MMPVPTKYQICRSLIFNKSRRVSAKNSTMTAAPPIARRSEIWIAVSPMALRLRTKILMTPHRDPAPSTAAVAF